MKLRHLLPVLLFFCFLVRLAHAGNVTLETDTMRWVIGADGTNVSLWDKTENREYLDTEKPSSCARVKAGGELVPAESARFDGRTLTLSFQNGAVAAEIEVTPRPGALILEDYAHAKARGAKIYAEVVGYGATCDAHHVTAPDPEATHIARAISESLINLCDIDYTRVYLNAHGTGTPLNDKTETAAIKKALGEDAKKIRISSIKSMTGHMLGAAGAVEAIACIKALESGIIPPTINLNEPDPECDLDYTPNTAVTANPEIALSTSLGFGGHNACVAFKKAE